VHNVSPGNIRGKVMIDQTRWSATADQVIPKGQKVKVDRVQGVKLIVRPFEERAAGGWEETLEVEA
jgi:membrane protein implicated in regulation of membrane protease activity